MPITNTASKLVTKASDLTGTGQVTLYTVPANHTSVVRALIVGNSDSSARNILVQWNDGSSTTNIFEARAIGANSSEALINDNAPLYLQAGNIVYVTATTANTLLTTISVEEYYDPNR